MSVKRLSENDLQMFCYAKLAIIFLESKKSIVGSGLFALYARHFEQPIIWNYENLGAAVSLAVCAGGVR